MKKFRLKRSIPVSSLNTSLVIISTIIILIIAFFLGWESKTYFAHSGNSYPLRLNTNSGGYRFINPLLACDITEVRGVLESTDLSNTITDLVRREISDGKITAASAYFRSFTDGRWSDVNENEKYYPASLTKVPVMMAYFKLAELQPDLLKEKLAFTQRFTNLDQQEILPRETLTLGQSYTVEELLKRMIVYSDNDAFWLLANRLDIGYVKEIFSDLGIPLAQENRSYPLDYITVKSSSLFFRLLYNATYTTWGFSEKALEFLSEADFKDGLVAGVPQTVAVAHKFGLFTAVGGTSGVTTRELHDCGIIYAPHNTYLLCIMTKGSSSLKDAESVLKDISSIVYQYVLGISKP